MGLSGSSRADWVPDVVGLNYGLRPLAASAATPPCALVARNCSPGYAFIPRSNNLPSHPDMEGRAMDSIIYLVGVVVVIMLVLSFLGLR